MLRKLKTANAQERDSWPETGEDSAANGDTAHSRPATIALHNKLASASGTRFETSPEFYP
jgi:hypothetical protein